MLNHIPLKYIILFEFIFFISIVLFYWINRNTKLKKKVHLLLTILLGFNMFLIFSSQTTDFEEKIYVVSGIAILGFLFYKLIIFCDICGRTVSLLPKRWGNDNITLEHGRIVCKCKCGYEFPNRKVKKILKEMKKINKEY